ncbi:MAG: ABC transporter permease [Spirochaetes bacterium]|nr:ABC transporter permease [Spirochaetota bacterium]
MLKYILNRILIMIPTVLLISFIVFWIIQLPPGDFLDTYISQAHAAGEYVDIYTIDQMRQAYGLDKPFLVQYGIWIRDIFLRGDFGYSFQWHKHVSDLIADRMGVTMAVSLLSLLFTYLVSVPIGILSATRQYSIIDYVATFIGFLGVAMPGFLLAIVLMYLSFVWFGNPMIGLVSQKFVSAAWSWAKVADVAKHMILPVVIIGMSGTCGLIRVMRGQLLDELRKQYVITARAKGVGRTRLLFKYPVRAALNPIVSTIGWSLAGIFSGSTITAIVLNLPMQGPLIYGALLSQDMYLAGGFLFILTVLTVIGTLVSDILLAWLDPRIRLGKEA